VFWFSAAPPPFPATCCERERCDLHQLAPESVTFVNSHSAPVVVPVIPLRIVRFGTDLWLKMTVEPSKELIRELRQAFQDKLKTDGASIPGESKLFNLGPLIRAFQLKAALRDYILTARDPTINTIASEFSDL
jgi:hypothetical protein